jgi:hypothetical protein
MSRVQLIAALNFAALHAHQYEEYEHPGYFPGQFNRGVFHSDRPERYPLNTNQAMISNTLMAYPFYLLPIAFPKKKRLGIAPVLGGFAQAAVHGVVFPVRARARYGPGFISAIFLHVPLGILYLRALKADERIDTVDWVTGALCALAFGVFGLAAPILLLRDRESPYAFTDHQVGRYSARN